jgi:metal-sulfur cluster biosynthetic enzyme
MSETSTRTQPSDEEIIESLKQVVDPELGINIIDLGLVYRIDIDDDGLTQVFMTLTTPGCPAGPQIKHEVVDSLSAVDGIGDVKVQFVFNPPWSPAMMSQEAKDELGIFDDDEE